MTRRRANTGFFLSVVMAWLFARTGGRLLPVMLLHAAINNTKDLVPSAVPGAADTFRWAASPVGWLTTAVLGIGAVVFLVRMRVAERSWEPESLVGSPIVPSR